MLEDMKFMKFNYNDKKLLKDIKTQVSSIVGMIDDIRNKSELGFNINEWNKKKSDLIEWEMTIFIYIIIGRISLFLEDKSFFFTWDDRIDELTTHLQKIHPNYSLNIIEDFKSSREINYYQFIEDYKENKSDNLIGDIIEYQTELIGYIIQNERISNFNPFPVDADEQSPIVIDLLLVLLLRNVLTAYYENNSEFFRVLFIR
jgi:hypothetical protein